MRDARSYVIQAIARQARRWPDLNTQGMGGIESDLADPRDQRAARALYQETVRRWLTLECLLNARLRQPLKQLQPGMQAVLLVGACQIFFMDHLPDHAVVSEAVEWARQRIRPGAAGMVNAVLHRMIDLRGTLPEALALTVPERDTSTVASPGHGHQVRSMMLNSDDDPLIPRSDGSILRLTDAAVLPADRFERLAAQTSCPAGLLRYWNSTGTTWSEAVERALHGLVHAPIIVRQDGGAADMDENLSPHHVPGFAVWNGASGSLAQFLAARAAACWVQDPASGKAIAEGCADVELDDGDLVVDLCAGTGTKTRQLAARFPNARLLAVDVRQDRLDHLRQVAGNWLAGRCEVRAVDDLAGFEGKARIVVADVPCSNTGVLARRVEARYRFDAASVASLVRLQRQILVTAIRLLAPGGCLVYSTCSLESEENGSQARRMATLHRLELVRECQTQPRGLPGDWPAHYADGAYYAVLR